MCQFLLLVSGISGFKQMYDQAYMRCDKLSITYVIIMCFVSRGGGGLYQNKPDELIKH